MTEGGRSVERAFLHLTYLSMNLRWNSERIVSLMKCFSWAEVKQWKIQWTFPSYIVQLKYVVTVRLVDWSWQDLFATFQTGRLYSSLPEPPIHCDCMQYSPPGLSQDNREKCVVHTCRNSCMCCVSTKSSFRVDESCFVHYQLLNSWLHKLSKLAPRTEQVTTLTSQN